MNLGAVIGAIQDTRERRALLEKLVDPDLMGFTETADGAWLWRFSLEELEETHAAPSGPAVALCCLMGLPFSRLRMAIPDDMVSWSNGTALGRTAALSIKELQVHHEAEMERQRKLKRARSWSGRPPPADMDIEGIPSTPVATPSKANAAAAAAAAAKDQFLGTALVLGFLQAEMLMPLPQLKKLQDAARRHFEGVLTPGGRDYSFLQNAWLVAFDGNLNSAGSWINCARLLKLVLSQRADGSWPASSSVAFALLARQQVEIENVPETLLDKLKARGGAGTEEHSEGLEVDRFDASPTKREKEFLKKSHRESLQALRTHSRNFDLTWDEAKAEANEEITDCPITFSVFALKETLPLSLAALGPDARPLDVWATICCIAVLERFKICWLVGDGELSPALETTIVDAAVSWLHSHCVAHPELAFALEHERGEAVHKKAVLLSTQWYRAWLHRVKLLRRQEAMTFRISMDQIERSGKALAEAVQTRHETFSTFLAPAGRTRRWQKFFIIITLVLCCLCMNIWMYELKAVNCCAALRVILDSGPDGGACPPGAGPCRGFEGNCADTTAQFADLPVLPDWPHGMADYECHAFPDDAKLVDSLLVALLSIAVATPVSLFIFLCFDLANDNDPPDSYLRWPFAWPILVWGMYAHKKWHYVRSGQPQRFVKWFIRYRFEPPTATLQNFFIRLFCTLTCREMPWEEEARHKVAEATEHRLKHHHAAGETDPAAAPVDPPPPLLPEASAAPLASPATAAEPDPTTPRGRALVSESLEVEEGHSCDDDLDRIREEEEEEDVRFKRSMVGVGIAGVYLSWAMFTWFIFVYGMLVYKLLGQPGVDAFSKSFGLSYALNQVSEWQDIVKTALKAIFVMLIMERLFISSPVGWIEEHIDYISVQAVMLRENLGLIGRIRRHLLFSRRMSTEG